MTLHLIKLCVGAGVDRGSGCLATRALAAQQEGRRDSRAFSTRPFRRQSARPSSLAGGSLYWVIKGTVQVRQRLIGFEFCHQAEGVG